MKENLTNQSKKNALTEEIEQIIEEIMKESDKYQSLIENNEVKNAFVVFRS